MPLDRPPPPPPATTSHSPLLAWQELSNKDQEKVAEVTRVRLELQEQNGRLQAELTAQEALKEKAAALERQLKGELSPRSPHPWHRCRAFLTRTSHRRRRWAGRAELGLGLRSGRCW